MDANISKRFDGTATLIYSLVFSNNECYYLSNKFIIYSSGKLNPNTYLIYFFGTIIFLGSTLGVISSVPSS